MKIPITLDFETMPIQGNPVLQAPEPIGLAVWEQGHDPYYHTDLETLAKLCHDLWKYPHGVLFHNAPFDLSVAEQNLGVPWPSWEQIHDTQILVFHYDPHGDLALKPASERILGLDPEERDELHEWIIANVPEARRKPSSAGAYIYKAPLELVEPYAIGDVERTWYLYEHIMNDQERMYRL
jgi:hypothetical protein